MSPLVARLIEVGRNIEWGLTPSRFRDAASSLAVIAMGGVCVHTGHRARSAS